MAYIGDFALGSTVYTKFTTVTTTGAPTQLAGTPVVSVYEDDSTTQITSGVTLTVDFDSVTGLNHLTIVASSGNGYEVGKQYQAVITTGTVGGTSVVGYVVAEFSIEATGLNLSNTTTTAGSIPALGYTDSGTLQSATATTAVLRSAASFADDRLNGMTLVITGGTGVGQARVITDYANGTDTATVDTWTTTPDNTSTYIVFSTPPVPATTVTNITGSLSGSVGSVTGDVGGLAAGAITDVETGVAASLAASGINPTDGVGRMAGNNIGEGGADPASPIGVV